MRVGRKLVVAAAVLLAAPFVGAGESPADLPVDLPGSVTAESGTPALTDVSIADTGTADEVVFTFAGDVVPDVHAQAGTPPFRNIPGEVLDVDGTSFAQVRMSPASGVSVGDSCSYIPLPPMPPATLFDIYFTCRDGLAGAAPAAPWPSGWHESPDPVLLQKAVEQLVAGPDQWIADAGLSSWFSPATAGTVSSVSVAPDGSAVIDFDPALAAALPGADSVAVSDEILRQLDATVFQFTFVTSALYTLGGSCDAFFAWLGRDCGPRTPADGAAARYAATYLGPDTVTGPSTTVTEAVLQQDFEAELVWVVGLRADADVTVTTATSPSRVIVRVAHTPPAAAPDYTG